MNAIRPVPPEAAATTPESDEMQAVAAADEGVI